MTLTVTVVHAPGAMPAAVWRQLRRQAPGDYGHELRLVLTGLHDTVSGAGLDSALRRFIAGAACPETPRTDDLRISTAGHDLVSLEPDSPWLHPGMVVLLGPPELPLRAVRPAQLSLCLDSGQDAGRLVALHRGRITIGRGQVDVPVADPAMSRREAELEVGTRRITVKRLRRGARTAATSVTAESTILLGATRCRLALKSPKPASAVAWPVAEESVETKPPEGKHRVMLAFALVPLVAGLGVALFTGHWFFLLFSAASALVAATVFWDGRRRRRRYLRGVEVAAQAWGERVAEALVSPGELARRLRASASAADHVHAGAASQEGPTVRLGIGTLSAELDCGPGSQLAEGADPQVETAVGLTLNPGEHTQTVGPQREQLRLMRWLIAQLALNPLRPQTLVVEDDVELATPELRDLPQISHTAPERLVARLATTSPGVLMIRAAAPGIEPELLSAARESGWHVISSAEWTSQSPGSRIDLTEATVQCQDQEGRPSNYARHLVVDGLSHRTLSEQLRLAARHCSTPAAGEIPAACTQQLPRNLFDQRCAGELIADLGYGRSGAQALDLVGDGPHLLIAGTTGSGKSELLKTLLLSLCARYGPDELGLVLIDFKGGATFHRIAQLEHSLGLVTDLSQAQAQRTLEGIRSELVRREKLFLDAGADDYADYRQLRPDAVLARVLVVIDEFRIFSHELPEQLDELMRLATLGRSLGLHLVLSTQRPQGVVTADIRANIGTSISLRVRSEEESRDTIGSTEAAAIPRSLPGRAVLRRPGENPQLLQTAQLTSQNAVLTLHPETRLPVNAAEPPEDVANTLRRALEARGLRRSHTPLLPPLPEQLGVHNRLSHKSSEPLLGRLDDPASQHQEDLGFDPGAPESLALLGESSAGGSDAAAALAAQTLSTSAGDVYLLDGDRSLAGLAGHPRVGGWLSEEDIPEAEHLLSRLIDELANRRMRRSPGAALLVVVTGWGRWHAAAQAGAGTLEHQLGTLAAEGPSVRIGVVVSGGRELSVGKLAGRIPRRIYLPYGASEDIRYLWPKLRSTEALPGRGVLLGPATPSPGLAVQLVTEVPSVDYATGGTAPQIRVRALPERIHLHELDAQDREGPGNLSGRSGDDAGPVVGIEQFSWAPARLELGPANLILGSSGTGKSSCLQVLSTQVEDAVLMVGGSGVPESMPPTLLVDDAHRCTPQQHQAIQQAMDAGVRVVATAPPSAGVFTQLPWAHLARFQGSNVLLSPTNRSEADAFATLIPVLERPIPGRAVHLRPDGAKLVHWALPE